MNTTEDLDTASATAMAHTQARQVRMLLAGGGAALALALIGTYLALSDDDEQASAPLAPVAAFAVLGQAQQPRDVVEATGVEYLVRPDTTRLLGEGPLGVHYLGIGLTGDVCVITPREQNGKIVADAACVSSPNTTGEIVMQLDGPGDQHVSLVADGYRLRDGWRAIGENLVTKAAT